MIHNQNLKVVTGTPATVGATATATLVIDRRGYDYASVLVSKAAVSAATAFASVLKVQEADTNSNDEYADIPALVLGGEGGFTVSAVSTTASSVVKLDVNCLAKKRYLRVSMTPDATAVVSMVAVLGRGEEYPYNAATANVATLVNG